MTFYFDKEKSSFCNTPQYINLTLSLQMDSKLGDVVHLDLWLRSWTVYIDNMVTHEEMETQTLRQ